MEPKEFLSKLDRKSLSEDEVKDILDHYGFKTPERMVIAPGEDIKEPDFEYPVVMKVCSPKILHKTDVGGVKLHIDGFEELKEAYSDMRKKFPGEKILVEEMKRPGVEAIIGVIEDATFGLTVMVGLGGIYTELYKDVSFRVLPITRDDADEMLRELKAHEIFEGFRGIKTNRDALIETLLNVSKMALDLQDYMSQMDLNPVFVREDDTVVVDAKMVLK
jgi:acyl-CoA synthetase (NDP forming)